MMKTVLSLASSVRLLRVTFALITVTPWLMWLDLNLMALRFVQLRGHWPMCDSVLPCRPTAWYSCDAIGTIWNDPVHLRLDPAAWQERLVFVSPLVWFVLCLVVGKHLPLATRMVLLAVFVLGWLCLLLDPTCAVGWYFD